VVCLTVRGLETLTKRFPRLKFGCSATEKNELILRSKFHLESLTVNMMAYEIFDFKERNIARTSE
jgi:hypothetical protein